MNGYVRPEKKNQFHAYLIFIKDVFRSNYSCHFFGSTAIVVMRADEALSGRKMYSKCPKLFI